MRNYAYARLDCVDFMLCDFKKDEVRRNFGEVLHICGSKAKAKDNLALAKAKGK